MSSLRSRSGGQLELHDVDAVEEVLPERARAATSAARSRLVAAMIRTSACSGRVDTERLECFSWSTRRSRTCSGRAHLADLVEEQGAALRQGEAPGLVPGRPR